VQHTAILNGSFGPLLLPTEAKIEQLLHRI